MVEHTETSTAEILHLSPPMKNVVHSAISPLVSAIPVCPTVAHAIPLIECAGDYSWPVDCCRGYSFVALPSFSVTLIIIIIGSCHVLKPKLDAVAA
jgi:hypothetical protein